jgi:hypothetical protein
MIASVSTFSDAALVLPLHGRMGPPRSRSRPCVVPDIAAVGRDPVGISTAGDNTILASF